MGSDSDLSDDMKENILSEKTLNENEENDEDNDEDEEEKPPRRSERLKNKKRNHDISDNTEYDNLISTIVNSMVADTENKIKNKKQKIRDDQWRIGLCKNQVKKYELEYSKISSNIYDEPTIQKVLLSNTPFQTKCNLMEKQFIFDNIQKDTFEHMSLKKYINTEIEKHRCINLNNYKRYDELEEKISKKKLDMPLKYKILSSGMSDINLSFVYKKYLQYIDLCSGSSENSKLLHQLETYINIPNNYNKLPINVSDSSIKINSFLFTVKKKLDNDIYGLSSVKEQIIIQLNNMIINPNKNSMNLALIGPQGVGKTALANSLAKSIDLAFTQINLGGATDSSFLVGHSYTYEGSQPGIIADSLIKMKSNNGIIFFDEIDKISKTKNGDDISKALLHIIDNTQNFQFKDKYLGNFNIDLSKIWFIFSLNYESELDKTLKDRLNTININGYTKKEKYSIVTDYLLPKYLKEINYNVNDIKFSKDSLNYIITETDKLYGHMTCDKNGLSGVRKLENCIQQILYKLSFIKNSNNFELFDGSFKLKINFKIPYTIDKNTLSELKIFEEKKITHNSMYT